MSESDLHRLWMARTVNFANYAAYAEHAFDTDEQTRKFIRARCEELEIVLG